MTKKIYDKTSTLRSQRFSQGIKESGGATFSVRFKTKESLGQLDALVACGYGASRNDVIMKLVQAEFKNLKTSGGKSGI